MTKKIFTLTALTVAAIALSGCFSQNTTSTPPSDMQTATGNTLTEATTPTNQPYEYNNKEK